MDNAVITNPLGPSLDDNAPYLGSYFQRMIEALDRDGYPPDGLCSPDGVRQDCGRVFIRMMVWGGWLQLRIGESQYIHPLPDAIMDEIEAVVQRVVGPIQYGGEGTFRRHGCITVATERSCPLALEEAIIRYNRIDAVWTIGGPIDADTRDRYEAFHDFFHEQLKRLFTATPGLPIEEPGDPR